jgi:membrane-associated HD superfamily phosphohydrolase
MKKNYLLVALFSLSALGANAQFGISRSINNSVQRGVERAVEKKAEEKAEEAASKGIDKALEQQAKAEAEAEKALNQAAEKIEEAQKAQEEADAIAASIPDEIPEVGSNPYTPSESEFAFFAMKKGAVQTFAIKDAKGKITSQTRNTIKEITGSKNAFAIAYQSEILDDKGKPTNKENPLILNYKIVVKDGIMYLDLKEAFGAIEGLDGYQASGTAQKIPSNMSVGQKIDDASMKVKISFLTCTAVMTDGKVVAEEDVTTEAGTFKCYKVSQNVNSTAMGIKNNGITLTWYAKGVGAVKTETYDSKGKLVSSQELIANN